MPVSPKTVTTAIFPTVFSGDSNLQSLTFKNGSNAGIIYYLNKKYRPLEVISSTVNDFSLTAGQSVLFLRKDQGKGIVGPWDAISDTAGGVTLEIIPFYGDRAL